MTVEMVPTKRVRLGKIRDGVLYYAHQVDGINRMTRMRSFLLSDEMGLGKSLQALTVAAFDFERDPTRRILVVCPASIKYNWLDEIELHTHFRAMVLENVEPKKRDNLLRKFEAEDYEILIVNYEQVKIHLEQLNQLAFDIVIGDEIHSIKSPTAKRTKAFMALQSRRDFMLTGSPMLNQVDELWTILYRISDNPKAWPGRYWSFRNRHAIFGGFEGRQIVGVKNQAELREHLGGLMIRRLKKDCLDLPNKIYKPEWLDLYPSQKKLYKEAEIEHRITISPEATPLQVENALHRALRFKQIANTTYELDPDLDESCKLDRLEEIAGELIDEGESFLVFSQFRKTLERVAARLSMAKLHVHRALPVEVIHGDVKPQQRQEAIRRWHESTAKGVPTVLAAMLQVGGIGLNLTASSTVIFVDKLWVPKLNEQAVDRVHRIGVRMDRPVTVIELLTRGTIERRIERVLKRKDLTFADIIEDASYDANWKKRLIEALIAEDED